MNSLKTLQVLENPRRVSTGNKMLIGKTVRCLLFSKKINHENI